MFLSYKANVIKTVVQHETKVTENQILNLFLLDKKHTIVLSLVKYRTLNI